MEKTCFQNILDEEDKRFRKLIEIDRNQKLVNEYVCRYIIKSFADRKAFYQIVDETSRKYILKWVLGESPYPDWGLEIKLPKKKVQDLINGRDHFDEFINQRRK